MKRDPKPQLPERIPWERLDAAFRTVLTVPKKALLKEEARLKRLRSAKRKKKKSTKSA